MKKLYLTRLLTTAAWLLLMYLGFSRNMYVTFALLFVTVIFGPLFCSWLCPFGFLQNLLGKLGRKLKLKQLNIPNKIHKYLKYLKFIVLGLVTLPLAINIMFILRNEPRTGFESLLMGDLPSLISLFIITLFALVSMFNERFYCKYLCPEGAKYNLLSVFRVYKISRNDKCVKCKKCNKTCPMDIDVMKTEIVNDFTCISCMDCIGDCKIKGSIKYKNNLKKQKYMIAGTIIVAGFVSGIFAMDNFIEKDLSNIKLAEGEYLGTATGFKSQITVKVSTNEGIINNIEVIDHDDDYQFYQKSLEVINHIINAGNTDVDTISGATYTSQGIINATKHALGEGFVDQTISSRRGPGGEGRVKDKDGIPNDNDSKNMVVDPKTLDVNGDGLISREEAVSPWDKKFDFIDLNKDDYLDAEELDKAMKKQRNR